MFSKKRFPQDLSPNPLYVQWEKNKQNKIPLVDFTETNPTQVGLAWDPKDLQFPLNGLEYYEPSAQGMKSARRAVAEYYRTQNVDVNPDNIFLFSGTSEAYSVLFKLLTDPGEVVMTSVPGYPLIQNLAALDGLEVVTYPLERTGSQGENWEINWEVLKQNLSKKTKAIIIVNPNNPTGSYVTNEDRKCLFEFCRENNVALIVDEVFLDYNWSQRVHPSILGEAEPPPLLFVLSGLSKILGLPQIKLSWMVVAGEGSEDIYMRESLSYITDSILSLSTSAQLAAPALLQKREAFQWSLKERVSGNMQSLKDLLKGNLSVEVLPVSGGWQALLDLNKNDSEDFCLRAVALGVLVHPGYFYDLEGEFISLSLILPPSQFERGIQTLCSLFHESSPL